MCVQWSYVEGALELCRALSAISMYVCMYVCEKRSRARALPYAFCDFHVCMDVCMYVCEKRRRVRALPYAFCDFHVWMYVCKCVLCVLCVCVCHGAMLKAC